MTLSVTVSVNDSAKGSGNLCLSILEVTATGIRNPTPEHPTMPGESRQFLMVHEHQAILLAECIYDFADDVPKDQVYRTINPLDEYLRREHPTMTMHDELRTRLAEAESQRDHWKKLADELRFKLRRITDSLGD